MRKLFLTTVIALLGMTGAMATASDTFTYQGDGAYKLEYTVNDDNTSVTCMGMENDGDAGASDLVIPANVSYNGTEYSVTSIKSLAFDACSGFTGALIIPLSVTSIGENAFQGCSGFTSLTILNATPPTVGSDVFVGTSFTEVNVPAGAKEAYGHRWQSLKVEQLHYSFTALSGDITLYYEITDAESSPKTVAVVSELHFFPDERAYNTAPAGVLTIPATVSHGGTTYSVTSIKENAFRSCDALTGALTIGSSVANIGGGAFHNCSGITGLVVLNTTPPAVGLVAFHDVAAKAVHVPAGSEAAYAAEAVDGLWHKKQVVGLNYSFKIQSDDNTLFYRITDAASNTVEMVAPHKLSAWANPDWNYYDQPTGVLNIPETVSKHGIEYSVTKIGSYAFSNCKGITSLPCIPNSVTHIGQDAFRNCSNLSGALTIPTSVMRIETSAFAECTALTSLTMQSAMPPVVIGNAFGGVTFTEVTVPAGAKAAYDGEAVDGLWQGKTIVEFIATSLDNATAAAPFTRVENTLYFGTATPMAVYNVSGTMLYSGVLSAYELPSAAGVYIIRTANSSVKVMK